MEPPPSRSEPTPSASDPLQRPVEPPQRPVKQEMPQKQRENKVSNSANPWRAKNPLASFRFAIEGIMHTFRTQRNMRFHFFAIITVLLAGTLLRLQRADMFALLFASSLVVILEMVNTSIETVVDMITDSYRPAAKYAKDVAAGAVLIAAINAVVVGGVVFGNSVRLIEVRQRLGDPPTTTMLVAAFLLMMVLLLLFKIMGKKGTLLQGGAVSGHAATAFFIAMTVVFFSHNILISIMAIALAALVVQSRLEAKFHTLQEVVLGATLAIVLTTLIYRFPGWVNKAMTNIVEKSPSPVRVAPQPQ
jgi:diacylglycerol kinase (ATP)